MVGQVSIPKNGEQRLSKQLLNWPQMGRGKSGKLRKSWREGMGGEISLEKRWGDREQWRSHGDWKTLEIFVYSQFTVFVVSSYSLIAMSDL